MHDFWLTYKEIRYTFKRYVDMDGSMAKDRHTITSYAFLINGGAVYWSFKWQEIILLSTTESEYVATTHGIKEALCNSFGAFANIQTFEVCDIVLDGLRMVLSVNRVE